MIWMVREAGKGSKPPKMGCKEVEKEEIGEVKCPGKCHCLVSSLIGKIWEGRKVIVRPVAKVAKKFFFSSLPSFLENASHHH